MSEFGYNPVPKPPKTEKKPKKGLGRIQPFNKKKPPQQKKKPPKKKNVLKAERSGLKVPMASVRNSFDEKNYDKAIEMFGITCNDPTCSMPACEMHHIVFRSASGRGVWRNAVPLCLSHHEKCHRSKVYNEMWKEARRRVFGEHFYKDKYDLWFLGLIADPLSHFFEEFMLNEERRMANEAEIHGAKKRGYYGTPYSDGQKRLNQNPRQN